MEKIIVNPNHIIVDPKKNFDNFIEDKVYMVIENVKMNGTTRVSPPKNFFGKFYRQYSDLVEFIDIKTNHSRNCFAYLPNKFYMTNIDIKKTNAGRGRRSNIRRTKKHKRTRKKRKF